MKILGLVFLAAALSVTAPAATTTMQLAQGGWSEGGGPLTLTFSAVDADANGAYDITELIDFSAVFALPGGAPAATFGLVDLDSDGFYFASEFDYFIRAFNDDFSIYSTIFEGMNLGLFSDFTGSYISITKESLTPTPEPSSVALSAASMMVGAAAMLSRKRRCKVAVRRRK